MSFIDPKKFGRPVNDENNTLDYRQFVSHEVLQERRYIVDDTIFIQVRITSSFFCPGRA